MQRAFRNGRALAALLFSLFYCSLIATAQSEDSSNKTSGTAISSNSSLISTIISSIHDIRNNDIRQTTCRTGTVNYITHSLPQQCLTRSTPTSNLTTAVAPTTAPSVSSSVTHEESKPTPAETPNSSATQPENEFETDSPLDNANFLSFEEWKKQNLAKVGQSPDHVGQKSRQDKAARDIRPIDNALDILGEDSEIELDFGGFGRQDSPSSSSASAQPTVASEPTLRSKDAGKTCKERSNYASFDCAATVLKSNAESKSAHAVLIENKDSYMLNICSSSNKFLIVELCNDILIDTIVLANYEFFSSIFRNFRVSVSDRYPVKPDRWRELGVFEARNTRSVQAFLVEQPLIWARYLRIEFLTHYGNEYYCPVSLLRVHGTTMMEEFRHQEELARGEISDDLEESVMPDASASPAPEPPQEPLQSSKEADKSVAVESATPVEKLSDASVVQPSSGSAVTSTETEIPATTSLALSSNSSSEYKSTRTHSSSDTVVTDTQIQPQNITSSEILHTPQTTANSSMQTDHLTNATSKLLPTTPSSVPNSTGGEKSPERDVTPPAQTSSAATVSAKQSSQQASAESSSKSDSTNSTVQASSNSSTPIKSTNSIHKPSSAASEVQQKPVTSTVSSAHSNPTTQESFFKSIHKRLQMLESNATLSLQYIEEQSRILRDAFIKVEKRQIKKTEAFLENLNATVFAELQDFKQQYDQLWQSTVIELDNHRDQYQREILAVSARLSIVADELVFQKRMAIAQMTVLMICLSLVLFVRAGGGASLDIPIIQQMVNKSQLARSSYYSPLNSPSPDQSSPPFTNGDVRRRRGFWRSNFHSPASPRPISRGNGNMSEASIEEHPQGENPDLRFQPPTPTLEQSNGTDGEDVVLVSPSTSFTREEGSFADEGIDSEDDIDDSTASLPQTQSSPSTPSGSRDLKMQPWPASVDGNSGITNDDPQRP
ncbi:hypothetical protein D6D01_01607 [Aureobasidium pullulans]|uniref:SUN domain-containing protein n=1 Tax=Aureobasidium pullulans TaxID=5580 RepID=A0A4S9LYG7_AURPU|nr:hypothetical protein D6D01_01607 [Aureobasidium pullulans]